MCPKLWSLLGLRKPFGSEEGENPLAKVEFFAVYRRGFLIACVCLWKYFSSIFRCHWLRHRESCLIEVVIFQRLLCLWKYFSSHSKKKHFQLPSILTAWVLFNWSCHFSTLVFMKMVLESFLIQRKNILGCHWSWHRESCLTELVACVYENISRVKERIFSATVDCDNVNSAFGCEFCFCYLKDKKETSTWKWSTLSNHIWVSCAKHVNNSNKETNTFLVLLCG